MYKLLLTLLFALSLNAKIHDGISIVVKGEPITLYDVQKEMDLKKINEKQASDLLIRRALEGAEIKERRITVSSSDVYEDIKKTAARSNMSVSDFYTAVRDQNGLSSEELKEQIKQKLESQKLYSAIAYTSMSQPSELDIEEYFELHKDEFSHPESFAVVIYQSKNQARLQEKIDNPMFYSPDIATNEQLLPYDRIAPELASLLERTPLNTFSSIVPDGKGGFMSFYVNTINSTQSAGIESVKNQIINKIMETNREQVLSEYFARLRFNADIKTLRTIN